MTLIILLPLVLVGLIFGLIYGSISFNRITTRGKQKKLIEASQKYLEKVRSSNDFDEVYGSSAGVMGLLANREVFFTQFFGSKDTPAQLIVKMKSKFSYQYHLATKSFILSLFPSAEKEIEIKLPKSYCVKSTNPEHIQFSEKQIELLGFLCEFKNFSNLVNDPADETQIIFLGQPIFREENEVAAFFDCIQKIALLI